MLRLGDLDKTITVRDALYVLHYELKSVFEDEDFPEHRIDSIVERMLNGMPQI